MTDKLEAADWLLTTTRAVRKRLDFSRPVENDVITECLRIAMQAPTGSNKQHWQWIVVTDAAKRKALADIYRRGAGEYLPTAKEAAVASGDVQTGRVIDSATYLLEHMQEAPVHVIPCLQFDMGSCPPGYAPIGAMGSIFPAVWSFQLALRARGLGTCLTTLHLNRAAEAAELLDLPADVLQVALLPVAYTLGTDFKQAKRRPMEDMVHWEGWSA
jgi:nitroreductase